MHYVKNPSQVNYELLSHLFSYSEKPSSCLSIRIPYPATLVIHRWVYPPPLHWWGSPKAYHDVVTLNWILVRLEECNINNSYGSEIGHCNCCSNYSCTNPSTKSTTTITAFQWMNTWMGMGAYGHTNGPIWSFWCQNQKIKQICRSFMLCSRFGFHTGPYLSTLLMLLLLVEAIVGLVFKTRFQVQQLQQEVERNKALPCQSG